MPHAVALTSRFSLRQGVDLECGGCGVVWCGVCRPSDTLLSCGTAFAAPLSVVMPSGEPAAHLSAKLGGNIMTVLGLLSDVTNARVPGPCHVRVQVLEVRGQLAVLKSSANRALRHNPSLDSAGAVPDSVTNLSDGRFSAGSGEGGRLVNVAGGNIHRLSAFSG